MQSQKRIMIFVDGSNFYHACRTAFGKTKLDMGELAHRIVERAGGELRRAYYYTSPLPQTDQGSAGQQRFLDRLRKTDYLEVRLGRLEPRGESMVEKEVDVMLASDMLYFAIRDLYDIAVIVSGDGDYRHAIQYVKDIGKHVMLAYPPVGRGLSCRALREVCDRTIDLTETDIHWL